jgi:hypothetical protein
VALGFRPAFSAHDAFAYSVGSGPIISWAMTLDGSQSAVMSEKRAAFVDDTDL